MDPRALALDTFGHSQAWTLTLPRDFCPHYASWASPLPLGPYSQYWLAFDFITEFITNKIPRSHTHTHTHRLRHHRDDDDRYVDQAYEERVQAQEKALTKAWPMFVATEGWARVNNPSKSQAKKIFQEYKEQKPDWQVLVRNLAEGQVRNGFTPRRADSRLRQVRAEADDVLNRRAQQERETQQQSLSLNT